MMHCPTRIHLTSPPSQSVCYHTCSDTLHMHSPMVTWPASQPERPKSFGACSAASLLLFASPFVYIMCVCVQSFFIDVDIYDIFTNGQRSRPFAAVCMPHALRDPPGEPTKSANVLYYLTPRLLVSLPSTKHYRLK